MKVETWNQARMSAKVTDFNKNFAELRLSGLEAGMAYVDADAIKQLRKFLKKLQRQLEGGAVDE